MSRAYDNRQRALLAAQTHDRIVTATEGLITTTSLSSVTLALIAERAGVTVQTVMRHMGSREGCIDAVKERVRSRILAQRGHTPAGDVHAALGDLLQHYEAEGRLILKLLTQEAQEAVAAEAVEEGRAFHRVWVERCFAPWLPAGDAQAVDALVGATDLYLWKLFRLDLGRTVDETKELFVRLVFGVLGSTCPRS